MRVVARHLLPVVEPRRRPKHRPGGGPAAVVAVRLPARSTAGPHPSEPTSAARALAIVASATLRRARRPSTRPPRWPTPAFCRAVELVRAHLLPIQSRPVLAASFGREAFHGDPSGSGDAGGPVTVAYAIRWLEIGDGVARPRWDAWLAESAPVPAEGKRPRVVIAD